MVESNVEYTWRPDFARWSGTCAGAAVSLQTAYQNNGTICSRFDFGAQPAPRTVRFAGAPPNPNQTIHDAAGFGGGNGGGGAMVTRLTMWSKNELRMNRTRWWLLQSDDVAGAPGVTAEGGYTFAAYIPANAAKTVTFCLTELEQPPPAKLPATPQFDPAPTTAKIDAWLADAAEPTALMDAAPSSSGSSGNTSGSPSSAVQMYYRSWYQFW